MRKQTPRERESRIPRKTREERRQWVVRYRKSGLSAKAFAQQHGLSVWTLRNWAAESHGKSTSSLPVVREVIPPWREPAPASPEWIAEVELPNGWVLRWKEGLKTAAAKMLLKALRPC